MRTFILISILMLLTCTQAGATLVQWSPAEGGNGHIYEVVWGYDPIWTWHHANAFAGERTLGALTGHLVTFDSPGEYEWLFENLNLGAYPPVHNETSTRFFIGGYWEVTACADPQTFFDGTGEPVWITGETWVAALMPVRTCGSGGPCSWCCGPIEDPFALVIAPDGQTQIGCGVSYGHLVVEYDDQSIVQLPWLYGDPVKLEDTTWGTVKALYR